MTSNIENSPFIIYENQKADASFEKTGKAIAEGKQRLRVGVKGLSPRFYIAGEMLDESLLQNEEWLAKKKLERYVTVNIGDKKVLLKIKSIAKRFHLTEFEVKWAAENNELGELLSSTKLEETIKYYESVIAKYQLNNAGKFESSKGVATHLNPESLMKIITIATKNLVPFYYENTVFSLKDHQWEIRTATKKLGEGISGTIYKIMNPDNPNDVEALKVVNIAKSSKIKKQIANEFHILTEIHKDGLVWGIQKPPRQVIQISKKAATEDIEGFITSLYHLDMMDIYEKNDKVPKELINPSFENKMIMLHQALAGLKYMEENHLLHGDLKPDNIFILWDNGFPITHLADFGSVVNIKKKPNHFISTHTSSYLYPEEYIQAEKCLKSSDSSVLEQGHKLGQKRDVLALGIALFTICNNFLPPFFLTRQKLTTRRTPNLFSNEFHKDLIDILEKMIKVNPEERASATETFDKFESFLIKENPKIYEKIMAKKKEYCTPKSEKSPTPPSKEAPIEEESANKPGLGLG